MFRLVALVEKYFNHCTEFFKRLPRSLTPRALKFHGSVILWE